MSPEQIKGRPVDARSDIFAFGCLLYEMASGRRAFSRETDLATLAAVLESEPQRIRELATEIPAGITAVIDRCLKKDPEQRFQNATDVDDALRTALASRSNAVVEPASKKIRAWARVAVALAGVVLAVAVAYYAWSDAPSRPSHESVAVLPFSGPQDDADIDYVADGLAESVTNSLSRLPGIRVAPRSKAFAYRGPSVSLEAAGGALGGQWL